MKLTFGYNAPLEEYAPDQLLKCGVLAEKCGFDTATASDHFHPWVHTNAHSGFAWVWLAALAERTNRVALGTVATAPILRYNPAIVAQAFATLDWLYPKRVFLSVGTGEAINEIPVGFEWPSPRERIERLEEAIKVIRLLWNENFVTFKGKYYRLNKANLYTRSKNRIPLYVAAGGPRVAKMAGEHGDGIITSAGSLRKHGDKLLSSFIKGARSAGKDPGSMVKGILITTSYDEDAQKAIKSARYWAATMLRFIFKYKISDPREIEGYAKMISDEQLASAKLITSKPEDYIKRIEELVKMGFNWILLLSSSPDHEKFIRMFGEKVIPYFKAEPK